MAYRRNDVERALEDTILQGLKEPDKLPAMYEHTLGYLRAMEKDGMAVAPFYALQSNRVLEMARGHGVDTSEGDKLRDELNARNLYSVAKRVCRPCIPDGTWLDRTVKASFGQCEACGQYSSLPDFILTLVTPFKIKV